MSGGVPQDCAVQRRTSARRTTRWVFSLAAVLSGALSIGPGAFACSCAGLSVPELFATHPVVVEARISAVDRGYLRLMGCLARYWVARYVKIDLADDPADWDVSCGVHATAVVDREWKGEGAGQYLVITGRGGGDCGFPFHANERYLLFLYRSHDDVMSTTICSGSMPLAMAGDALAEISELASRGLERLYPDGHALSRSPAGCGGDPAGTPPSEID